MRQFKFDPSRGWKKNEEFMPPPAHTNQILPFNWGWHQNPQLTMEVNQLTGETTLVHNESTRKSRVDYVPAGVVSVPQSSPYEIPQDRGVREVIAKLTEALNERPVWTRRALGNRIGHEKLPVSILKALHHVVYQFKGGPFRDAVIKYGIDPRTDKKYRNYQTVFFQIYEEEGKGSLKQWKDVRTNVPLSKNFIREDPTTHIFDGKTLALDGKIWQLCDITDPLLVRLIKTSTLRDEYEPKSDGYFSNGAWAKIHAIMRIKLIAIRANATLTESDLEDAINVPDVHDDNRKESRYINVPVPDIRMTGSEAPRVVEDEVNSGIIRPTGIRKRRKLRYMRISQNLAKKRSYVSQKPIPAQSRPGVRNQSKKMPQGNQETRSQEQIVPTDGHNAERAATGINSSRAEQRESTSAEYLTAEENADHTREGIVGIEGYVEEDEGEDDEREFEDEDSENRESDEDSGDEGVGNDEDGLEDREDLEGDFDEEEYDSEATDVVDFTT
jgi:general transcription factor 3C polypeptide 5 (transcription factor C subunit 1)